MGGTSLTIPNTSAEIVKRLAEYQHKARGALSSNTERALKADTAVFTAWCVDQGRKGLPASPVTVARFIDAQADVKAPATVRRYASSIARLRSSACSSQHSPGHAPGGAPSKSKSQWTMSSAIFLKLILAPQVCL